MSVGKLADLQEPARTEYEERYIAAIRLVGSRYIEKGDIPTAAAYYRAIAETEPLAAAISAYQPAENDERLGAVIEVALNHGVHPRKGFELILENYGTCPAISAFEQLPPQDEAVRTACVERLVRHLHSELTANLRAEITRRGQVVPPEGTTIAGVIAGRPWLFTDDAYHIDISHLASVVRMSLLARDRDSIAMAVDLTAYGRCLSPRLVFDGAPPFEKVFDDHGVYLNALIGNDSETAVAHFRRKLNEEIDRDEEADPIPAAQVLVKLLLECGKLDEAIDVAADHLAGIPESSLACPSLNELCQRAGRSKRLAQVARDTGDLVAFTAAQLQSAQDR
jgi:hypothetical protein